MDQVLAATGWEEQWNRVQRYHDRLMDHFRHRDHDEGLDPVLARDDAYSFFQNAFHLKDWLKNDVSVAATDADQNRIETLLLQHPALDDHCRAICNASKHLVLKGPRSGSEPRMGSAALKVAFGGASHGMQLGSLVVDLGDGTEVDVRDLASKVLDSWRVILADLGLGV